AVLGGRASTPRGRLAPSSSACRRQRRGSASRFTLRRI
ncbi:MAG: hypothetical protein AVDCRST_MAG19-1881, partial [uncultured Thermomicrobiales bacterium]